MVLRHGTWSCELGAGDLAYRDTKPPMDKSLFHVNCVHAIKPTKRIAILSIWGGEGIREDHNRSPLEVTLKLKTGRELGAGK